MTQQETMQGTLRNNAITPGMLARDGPYTIESTRENCCRSVLVRYRNWYIYCKCRNIVLLTTTYIKDLSPCCAPLQRNSLPSGKITKSPICTAYKQHYRVTHPLFNKPNVCLPVPPLSTNQTFVFQLQAKLTRDFALCCKCAVLQFRHVRKQVIFSLSLLVSFCFSGCTCCAVTQTSLAKCTWERGVSCNLVVQHIKEGSCI